MVFSAPSRLAFLLGELSTSDFKSWSSPTTIGLSMDPGCGNRLGLILVSPVCGCLFPGLGLGGGGLGLGLGGDLERSRAVP